MKRRNKMENLIIFKEAEKMALDPSLENLVLFGESRLISDGKDVYDLIFHAKQIDPYDTLKATSLVIPVLRLDSDNHHLAVKRVYNAYLNHPQFTLYSVASGSLKFFEVNPKEYGKEIISSGKYKRVGKRDFFNLARGTELAREVMEKIRVIDTRYQAAF